MNVTIHDDTQCELGEGPLWHPERDQFYWFNIRPGQLLTRTDDGTQTWDIGENASAAGWVDRDTLLMATETRLLTFDLNTGVQTDIAPLEADNPVTRSNDGRADPHGGFWIGTMGKQAEDKAGAFYRYHRGELRKLYDNITVSNACCFSPSGDFAHFCDTRSFTVMRVALDGDGWPKGEPELWLDLRADKVKPDGAVIAADGTFWCAHYGGGRVAAYDPAGTLLHSIEFPVHQTTCPAFGGPDMTTLFCTTAAQALSDADRAANPDHGRTFEVADVARGLPEYRVVL